MGKMMRKWTRRTTMTETKDDSDDNNSRVPNKTDDQRLPIWQPTHTVTQQRLRSEKSQKKNKQTTDLCVTLWCFMGVVNFFICNETVFNFVSKREEKETTTLFQFLSFLSLYCVSPRRSQTKPILI